MITVVENREGKFPGTCLLLPLLRWGGAAGFGGYWLLPSERSGPYNFKNTCRKEANAFSREKMWFTSKFISCFVPWEKTEECYRHGFQSWQESFFFFSSPWRNCISDILENPLQVEKEDIEWRQWRHCYWRGERRQCSWTSELSHWHVLSVSAARCWFLHSECAAHVRLPAIGKPRIRGSQLTWQRETNESPFTAFRSSSVLFWGHCEQ